MVQLKRPAQPVDGAEQAPTAAAQPPQIAVPERPQLAPDVELSGEMAESGFAEQQWLVQRKGRFLQLTALLYRVLEQIDGQRTLGEIAEQASQTYGKRISDDNVRTLLTSKLIPLGLVLDAEGKAFATETARGPSPLQVNMKMAMINPTFIERFTGVLQLFFLPPVLLLALVASFAALGWIFFAHGIGASVRNAIYQPGLLLAALAMIVLAAAFHEFGHASALRKGGGRVREMGFGIYLIYPAFYTDVSDNYRLGRWARVRTDLGGFYFNLLFALTLTGLFFILHWEFLLLVVVLICFDIIRQMMPFVRLDGYWALADLTGIPDFFSQIVPFLRTVLPIPGWKGRRLPNLRSWVKAVFALYLLITAPLLAFIFFVMIKTVPRVLATAWDSFGKLIGQFSHAAAHGSILAMVAAAVQMITLALPTLGMLFVLFTVGRKLLAAAWHWGEPSAARRATSVIGIGAVAFLIASLWLPQLPAVLGVGRHKPAPLTQGTAFRPLTPADRGTVSEALAAVPLVGSTIIERQPTVPAAPTAKPARSEAAQGATATATVGASPTAGATAASTAEASPTATPSPTPSPVVPVGARPPAATPAARPAGGAVAPQSAPPAIPTVAPAAPVTAPQTVGSAPAAPVAAPQTAPPATRVPTVAPRTAPPASGSGAQPSPALPATPSTVPGTTGSP